MASSKLPFDSVDLTTNPSQINEIDFRTLHGIRSDLLNWEDTVTRLTTAHERFYKLTSVPLMPQLQGINNFFVEAVNWLQGKAATANFIAIPPTSGISNLTQEQLNQFHDNWLPNFEANMNNDASFLAFENFSSLFFSQLGSLEVDSRLQEVINTYEAKISNLEVSFKDFMSAEKTKAIGEIRQAKALEDWVTYYKAVENDYSILIEGSHRLHMRSITINHPNSHQYKKRQFPIYISRRIEKNASTVHDFKIGEAKKRLFWFVTLGVAVLLPALLGIIGGTNLWFNIPNPFYVSPEQVNFDAGFEIYEKLRYLPFLIIPAFGYAFSNKNYRIFSNLREQYRHRSTVSNTLQGIIAGIAENDANKDIRVKLVEIGAKAMFDLKTIGHLTKKDSDSTPMAEIVQTISPNR